VAGVSCQEDWEHHDQEGEAAFTRANLSKSWDADWILAEGGDVAAVLNELNVTEVSFTSSSSFLRALLDLFASPGAWRFRQSSHRQPGLGQ
jgi:hypothetical protein